MDLGSSPKYSGDDALKWESSDSEIKLLSAKIAPRRHGKAVVKLDPKAEGTNRGTKRTRDGDIKLRESSPSDIQDSQSSSLWADKYAPTAIVSQLRWPITSRII